jgi:type IV secretory pathway VirB4 component
VDRSAGLAGVLLKVGSLGIFWPFQPNFRGYTVELQELASLALAGLEVCNNGSHCTSLASLMSLGTPLLVYETNDRLIIGHVA